MKWTARRRFFNWTRALTRPFSTVTRQSAKRIAQSDLGKSARSVGIAQIGFAGTVIGNARIVLMPDLPEDDGISGSIGMDWLLGKIVVLDYVRQRFCLADDDHWIAREFPSIAWLRADLHNDRLFVPISLPHLGARELMFDTGASAAPLILNHRDDWLQLTGLRRLGQASSHHTAVAWGQAIDIYTAPVEGRVSIGDSQHDRTMAWHIPQGDVPGAPQGIIGNPLFWNGSVVLDLRQQSRFGIVTSV